MSIFEQNKRKTKDNTKLRSRWWSTIKMKIYILQNVFVHFENMEGFRSIIQQYVKFKVTSDAQ